MSFFNNVDGQEPNLRECEDINVGVYTDEEGIPHNIALNGTNNKYKILSLYLLCRLSDIINKELKKSEAEKIVDLDLNKSLTQEVNDLLNDTFSEIKMVTSKTGDNDEETLKRFYFEQDIIACILFYIDEQLDKREVNKNNKIVRNEVKGLLPQILKAENGKTYVNPEYTKALKGLILSYYEDDPYVKKVIKEIDDFEKCPPGPDNKQKMSDFIKRIKNTNEALKYKKTEKKYSTYFGEYLIQYINNSDDSKQQKIYKIKFGDTVFESNDILEYSDAIIKCKKNNKFYYIDRYKGIIIKSDKDILADGFDYSVEKPQLQIKCGDYVVGNSDIRYDNATGNITFTLYDYSFNNRNYKDAEITFQLPKIKYEPIAVPAVPPASPAVPTPTNTVKHLLSNKIILRTKIAPFRFNKHQLDCLQNCKEICAGMYKYFKEWADNPKEKTLKQDQWLNQMGEMLEQIEQIEKSIDAQHIAVKDAFKLLRLHLITVMEGFTERGPTNYFNIKRWRHWLQWQKPLKTEEISILRNYFCYFNNDFQEFYNQCLNTNLSDSHYKFFNNSLFHDEKSQKLEYTFPETFQEDFLTRRPIAIANDTEYIKMKNFYDKRGEGIKFSQDEIGLAKYNIVFDENYNCNIEEIVYDNKNENIFEPIEHVSKEQAPLNEVEEEILSQQYLTTMDDINEIYNHKKDKELNKQTGNDEDDDIEEDEPEKEERDIAEAISKGEKVVKTYNHSLEHGIVLNAVSDLDVLSNTNLLEKLINFIIGHLWGPDEFKERYNNAIADILANKEAAISEYSDARQKNEFIRKINNAVKKARDNLWGDLKTLNIQYIVDYDLETIKKDNKKSV